VRNSSTALRKISTSSRKSSTRDKLIVDPLGCDGETGENDCVELLVGPSARTCLEGWGVNGEAPLLVTPLKSDTGLLSSDIVGSAL
jgi:hypothetical protein